MKNIIRIIVLACLSVNAHGYSDAVLGYGTKSCNTWTEERSKESSAAAHYEDWVLGFLTGANAYMPGNMLKVHSEAGLLGWVDTYCKENPLKRIVDAADRLTVEIVHFE